MHEDRAARVSQVQVSHAKAEARAQHALMHRKLVLVASAKASTGNTHSTTSSWHLAGQKPSEAIGGCMHSENLCKVIDQNAPARSMG